MTIRWIEDGPSMVGAHDWFSLQSLVYVWSSGAKMQSSAKSGTYNDVNTVRSFVLQHMPSGALEGRANVLKFEETGGKVHETQWHLVVKPDGSSQMTEGFVEDVKTSTQVTHTRAPAPHPVPAPTPAKVSPVAPAKSRPTIPFQAIRMSGLGAPDQMQSAIAKAQLITWAKTDGAQSKVVADYPTAADLSPSWSTRDKIVLAAFSQWWNKSGFLPPELPTNANSELGEAHVVALTSWAAKTSLALPKPPEWPGALGWPPPKPWAWPQEIPWPPLGSAPPPGWPAGIAWPPPAPPSWPSSVPWPLPLPVPPIGTPTTLPAPPSGGPLPPPPAPQPGPEPGPEPQPGLPPTKTSKKSSGMSTGAILGLAAAGIGALLLFGGSAAFAANPRGAFPRPKNPPKPHSAYGMWKEGGGGFRGSDEDWDIVVYTPTGSEYWVGTREIDGAPMNVWKATGGYIAQSIALTGFAKNPKPLWKAAGGKGLQDLGWKPPKFRLMKEPLDRGGYTTGSSPSGRSGRYFGIGEQLWFYEGNDFQVQGHVRASSRAAAKAQILAKHPNATFYRG